MPSIKFIPHPYQQQAIDILLEKPYFGLLLDMGLGKSIISLSAFSVLQNDLAVDNCLVIAPKRVAQSTWSAEAEKWEHTKHLRVSKILGTQAERIRAISTKADIYVINRENVVWLYEYLKEIVKRNPFDMLIIDELSSFKSPSAQRFKALRKMAFKRVVGLTGTPAPNGEMDLWSQIYLLDKGERLGKTITVYRNEYFTAGWGNGNIVYKYNLRKGAQEAIQKKIEDICLSMKAVDYLTLPERIDIVVDVELEPEVLAKYREFEREMILGEITALNAASLAGKLVQFANGAIYNDDGGIVPIHAAKLEALDEIVEAAMGEPILVAYNYKHDLSRLLQRYKFARKLDTEQDLKDWNDGKIKMLLAHPASAGHGLNLQAGGSIIVWFGNTWSLELYQQFNARLHRQGQQNSVRIYHLVAKGTFDEKIIEALRRKDATQEKLLSYFNALKLAD